MQVPLSAGDGSNDFDAIAFTDAFLFECAAAYNAIVLGHGDTALRRMHVREKLREGHALGQFEFLAVNRSFHVRPDSLRARNSRAAPADCERRRHGGPVFEGVREQARRRRGKQDAVAVMAAGQEVPL